MAWPRWTYRVIEVNCSLDSFKTAQKFAKGCVREGVTPHAATLRPARADHPAMAPEYGGQIKTAWRGARSRAGLDPELTPHDLRHTAASLAISAGANVKAVQTMLGHASAVLTLDTYADLFPDDLDDVADKMDDLVSGCAQRARSERIKRALTWPLSCGAAGNRTRCSTRAFAV